MHSFAFGIFFISVEELTIKENKQKTLKTIVT